jgi:hypothetical protein
MGLVGRIRPFHCILAWYILSLVQLPVQPVNRGTFWESACLRSVIAQELFEAQISFSFLTVLVFLMSTMRIKCG